MNTIYINNVHPWAPGLESKEDWLAWKQNEKQIIHEKKSPKLEFTEPLFRRRLSQISKMTIQVVHDLIEEDPQAKEYKQVFVSFRGEIEREFLINKGIIEDSEILPAGFSLSVFNTPIALSTLALKLKAGYSVIYPSKNNFSNALIGASAPILCNAEENIILIYADEIIPNEYENLASIENEPLAFACIISNKKTQNSKEIQNITKARTPTEFLKEIL